MQELLAAQDPGSVFTNPLKYAIRAAVEAGVPVETIVLLLLLPLVAAVIAAARHIVGLRGFGIFLPAALSVVFLATGPVVGIGLFLIIIAVSTLTRVFLRRFKIAIQYLPRMALILWVVVISVLGLLFVSPYIQGFDLGSASIFSILLLVLLSEDFIKTQTGRSARTAIALTSETLIVALVSFAFLVTPQIQTFALLQPEVFLLAVGLFNFAVSRYLGLRLLEAWRFRKIRRR